MMKSEKDEVAVFEIGYNYWLSNGKDFMRELEKKFNVEVIWHTAAFSGWQEGVIIVIGMVASVIEIAEFLYNRLKKGESEGEVTAWVVGKDGQIILNDLTKDEIAKLIIEALEEPNYRDWLEERRKMKDAK